MEDAPPLRAGTWDSSLSWTEARRARYSRWYAEKASAAIAFCRSPELVRESVGVGDSMRMMTRAKWGRTAAVLSAEGAGGAGCTLRRLGPASEVRRHCSESNHESAFHSHDLVRLFSPSPHQLVRGFTSQGSRALPGPTSSWHVDDSDSDPSSMDLARVLVGTLSRRAFRAGWLSPCTRMARGGPSGTAHEEFEDIRLAEACRPEGIRFRPGRLFKLSFLPSALRRCPHNLDQLRSSVPQA